MIPGLKQATAIETAFMPTGRGPSLNVPVPVPVWTSRPFFPGAVVTGSLVGEGVGAGEGTGDVVAEAAGSTPRALLGSPVPRDDRSEPATTMMTTVTAAETTATRRRRRSTRR